MPSKEDFFREHYAYAREAGLSDVQARVAVAQAAVETGWGTKGVAVKGNNYHGMKVGDDWDGPSISLPTREETKKGKSYTVNADFRQYETPVDSYRDWASKMATNWPGVMTAKTFDEAVSALNNGVKGVYATAKSYPASLKDVNRSLEQSGVPAEFGAPQQQAGGLLGDYQLGQETTNIGAPGRAMAGLVPSTPVKTTTVTPGVEGLLGAGTQPRGLGLAALAGDYRVPLDKVDFTQIPGVEPNFAAKLNDFRAKAIAKGLNLGVDVGAMVRTQAQQDAALASGASKTKLSFHQLGLAGDISPLDAVASNNWASAQWAPMRQLADDEGFSYLGGVEKSWDPAHLQAFPGAASAYAGLPRDELGRVKLSPQQALAVRRDVVPVPTARPVDPFDDLLRENAIAPAGAVERAPLAPPSEVAGLGVPEYAQGLQPGSFQQPEASGLLNPVGQVERAPLGPVASLGSLDVPAERYGALNPEKLSPLAPSGTNSTLYHNPVHERVIGQEVGGLLSPALTAQGLLGAPATLAEQTAQLAQQQQPAISPPNVQSATTIAPPGIDEAMPSAGTTTTIDDFPAAPQPPTRAQTLKESIAPALKQAALSGLVGGLPGAAMGLATGLLGPQIGGLGSLFGGQPGLSPYGVGSGLGGMSAAIGGPRGAQGTSRSNPGMSYTSLGPNQGGLRRSDKYGWTEVVGPDGSVRGISYDDPEGGGLLGSISRGVGGLLGGRGMSDKERGKYAGRAGLY